MCVYVRQAKTGVPPPIPGPEASTARCDLMLTYNTGGSPERPAASDTLHIRLRRVFQKALHSLGQELIFSPQETCVFQQKFNPWGSNSFTLTSVKMAFLKRHVILQKPPETKLSLVSLLTA